MVFAAIICLTSACTDDSRPSEPPVNRTPPDFRVVYSYRTPPLAPVYCYTYSITIDRDLRDTVWLELAIGPPEERPRKTITFNTPVEQMNMLYDSMIDRNILRDEWERVEPTPCGSPCRSMWITAGGEVYYVPSDIAAIDSVLPVYSSVCSSVHPFIWEKLWAWRDRYTRHLP